MVAEIQNRPDWHHDDESLIGSLAANFEENDLPYERVTQHHLRLPVQGHWQRYEVSIKQAPNNGDVLIECQLNITGIHQAVDKLYPLLAQMNNSVQRGYYCVEVPQGENNGFVGYRLNIPDLLLSALDIYGLEELVDSVLLATENLFPVCQSLLNGKQTVASALGKYIEQPQGHA